MPTPNTASTNRILVTIRTQLLTFVPLSHVDTGTRTIATLLGSDASAPDGRMYLDAAPDDGTYPYGVLRMVGPIPGREDSGMQMSGFCELQLFDKPRSQARLYGGVGGVTLLRPIALNAMADIATAAWRDFVLTAIDDTLVAQRIRIRGEVPYSDPANRELVQVRMLLPFYCTPAFLAQYSTLPVL